MRRYSSSFWRGPKLHGPARPKHRVQQIVLAKWMGYASTFFVEVLSANRFRDIPLRPEEELSGS